MSSKERSTKIIAHVAKSTLLAKFPDYNTLEKLVLRDKNGIAVDEIPRPGEDTRAMIEALATEAGYTVEYREDRKQDQGWIAMLDNIYSVSEVSERKCSIHFKSYNKDEADHYAKVDEIVKELALNDVAVLQGECSITITTRC